MQNQARMAGMQGLYEEMGMEARKNRGRSKPGGQMAEGGRR